jgi:hypothetical protein
VCSTLVCAVPGHFGPTVHQTVLPWMYFLWQPVLPLYVSFYTVEACVLSLNVSGLQYVSLSCIWKEEGDVSEPDLFIRDNLPNPDHRTQFNMFQTGSVSETLEQGGIDTEFRIQTTTELRIPFIPRKSSVFSENTYEFCNPYRIQFSSSAE